MTRDDILKMEVGREMDALVAEKVMEWKRAHYDYVFWQQTAAEPLLRYCSSTLIMNNGDEIPNYYQPFHPSRDIAAAWEVVKQFRDKDSRWCPSIFWDDDDGLSVGYWNADFTYYGDTSEEFKSDEAIGGTAPLAICRAALLAVMEVE